MSTWNELETKARNIAGATDRTHPNPETLMRMGNNALQKIGLLTRMIDEKWGKNTLTISSVYPYGKYYEKSSATSYTASTKTLAGITLDQTYCGGVAIFEDAGNSRSFQGTIDHVNSSGTNCILRFVKGTGATANISGSNLTLYLFPNSPFYPSKNLNSINKFSIVKCVDSGKGNVIRLGQHEFAEANQDYALSNSVVMQDAGEVMYFDLGSDVTSFGTIVLTYNALPDEITSLSSVVDIRPEHEQNFVEELARLLHFFLNKPITDPKLNSPLGDMEQKFKASVEKQ